MADKERLLFHCTDMLKNIRLHDIDILNKSTEQFLLNPFKDSGIQIFDGF